MGVLRINDSKCSHCLTCVSQCPFKAIEEINGKIEINASCRMCKICIKSCPEKAILLDEEKSLSIDKSLWKGILVFVEQYKGEIHPVSIEMIGKAKELAEKINYPVYTVTVGSDEAYMVSLKMLQYGVDKAFYYRDYALEDFRVDIYSNVIEDLIKDIMPSVVLVGATSIGRSLAPRLSARFRTGLTADCTVLDIKENSDLVQIRPAFGGNIMAQIITKNSRPQFATVRYKVMKKAEKTDNVCGIAVERKVSKDMLLSGIEVLKTIAVEKQESIEEAEIIIAAGRGVKTKKDMEMIENLASVFGAQIAGTRPLIESGWLHYTKQIGLSGRTVKPKLIITCGISGAVQFAAGMKNAECIISINKDKNAPIFNIANYCIVGDIYEVIPQLIKNMNGAENYERAL